MTIDLSNDVDLISLEMPGPTQVITIAVPGHTGLKGDKGDKGDPGEVTQAQLDTAVAGRIPAFADPNADRLVFWDDSAGAWAALAASTGLTISGTNITVRAGSETQTGIVELATAAETTTGTDSTRAVHPAGLKVELNKKVTGTGILNIVKTTQAAYDAIVTKDDATLYLIGS